MHLNPRFLPTSCADHYLILMVANASYREAMFDRNAKAILDCIGKTGMWIRDGMNPTDVKLGLV